MIYPALLVYPIQLKGCSWTCWHRRTEYKHTVSHSWEPQHKSNSARSVLIKRALAKLHRVLLNLVSIKYTLELSEWLLTPDHVPSGITIYHWINHSIGSFALIRQILMHKTGRGVLRWCTPVWSVQELRSQPHSLLQEPTQAWRITLEPQLWSTPSTRSISLLWRLVRSKEKMKWSVNQYI